MRGQRGGNRNAPAVKPGHNNAASRPLAQRVAAVTPVDGAPSGASTGVMPVVGGSTPGQKPFGITGMKKGGSVKSSASKRADGCATKGKTRGKIV